MLDVRLSQNIYHSWLRIEVMKNRVNSPLRMVVQQSDGMFPHEIRANGSCILDWRHQCMTPQNIWTHSCPNFISFTLIADTVLKCVPSISKGNTGKGDATGFIYELSKNGFWIPNMGTQKKWPCVQQPLQPRPVWPLLLPLLLSFIPTSTVSSLLPSQTGSVSSTPSVSPFVLPVSLTTPSSR